MSKKHKQKQTLPERPLAERIEKARKEGRTQQALDLTRQLCKQQNTEANNELLRQVTLERGQQLQEQGMLNDAITVYTNALMLSKAPAYRARVIERLAGCGAITQALALIGEITDPKLRQQILGQVVDAAVAKGAAGKAGLPADLQPTFDLVLQAFAHSEAGRDEQARTALQSIGLQSPFLEWKLFLRGLLAYYAQDDARTVENWQRLDPHRLPARLAAPLWCSFDQAFRKAQPAGTQPILSKQMDRLRGSSNVVSILQNLRQDLPHENLAPAFRKAEQAVASLRTDRPDLVTRLSHCFFWAILDHGQPEDLERYMRVFGRPTDDPSLHRLEALALEMRGMMVEAHKAWQNFIKEAERSPKIWPGEAGKRVQAMIWARMAENATMSRKRRRGPPSPLDFFAPPPMPALKPSAEECYRHAIDLAPDRLESYQALFEFYRQENQSAKAKKIGEELVQRFPRHSETLEELGELYLDSHDYKKAQEYFDQSLQANPLDRSLRGKLARARQKWGLELTLQSKFDQARQQYELALKLWEGSKTSLLCQWAVAEMKAKNQPRADELLAQAQADPDHRLACRYALVSESVRAKLTTKEKKKLTDELKAALAQDPTPTGILVLLETAAEQRLAHDKTFRGQKMHEKTILKFLEQLHFDQFSEAQLERLCVGLQGLQARKPWMSCLEHARRRYLKNPVFRLSWVDYYLTGPNPDDKVHLAREHLAHARQLIDGLPRGEQQQQLQEQIQEKEKIIAGLGAGRLTIFDMMEQMFGGGGGGEEEEFEEEDF